MFWTKMSHIARACSVRMNAAFETHNICALQSQVLCVFHQYTEGRRSTLADCMLISSRCEASLPISSILSHLNEGLAEGWDACPRACMFTSCMLLKCKSAGWDVARGSSFRRLPDFIEPAPGTKKYAPIAPKIQIRPLYVYSILVL